MDRTHHIVASQGFICWILCNLCWGRLRAGRDYIIGILQKYSIPLCFGVPLDANKVKSEKQMEFGTVGNRHTDVTYTRIFSWNGQRLVQAAWQDSDWGVPGIVVEQCARRKLFRAGTLDSNQRRRTLPLWILWCVMLSFHQRRGWGIHTPRQKTDERENNIFFTDHSSVRVLAVTQLKLCRIQAGRTRRGFSFRDQRLFYVPLLHWVWKFDIPTCRV